MVILTHVNHVKLEYPIPIDTKTPLEIDFIKELGLPEGTLVTYDWYGSFGKYSLLNIPFKLYDFYRSLKSRKRIK